ncbi:hypothetical protein ECG_01970 [Echinococcus granulosus]|nr:hypothetical protein ECG_01970 [Echinococcus granulosus]
MEDVLPSSLVPLTYLLAGERLSVSGGSRGGPHSVASRLLPLPPPLPPSRPKSSPQLSLTLTSKSNTTTLTPLLPVPEWQALPTSSIPAPTAQFALPHIAIVTPCNFISSLQGSAFTQPFLSKCEVTGGAKSKCGADGPREARTDAVPTEDGVERARRDGELEEEANIEEFCTAGTALHSSSEAEIITGYFFFPVTNPWYRSPGGVDSTTSLSSANKDRWNRGEGAPVQRAPSKSQMIFAHLSTISLLMTNCFYFSGTSVCEDV